MLSHIEHSIFLCTNDIDVSCYFLLTLNGYNLHLRFPSPVFLFDKKEDYSTNQSTLRELTEVEKVRGGR